MKKISLTALNNAQFNAVLPDGDADAMMDQFYSLSTIDISDHLFEMSIKNETGKLENLLIPYRSILYIQCREYVE